jgi:hypothetical protein
MLFAATKGAVFAVVVLVITMLFGATATWWCVLVPLMGFRDGVPVRGDRADRDELREDDPELLVLHDGGDHAASSSPARFSRSSGSTTGRSTRLRWRCR